MAEHQLASHPNFIDAINKEYQLQTGDPESSLHPEDLVLLDETKRYWIIKYTGEHDDQREVLNVVWKENDWRMESIEL